ncbi:hypothetical protein RND81_02G088000 [Saponaria officinalis]|uniref:Tetratricopeptide repeat protein 33 n=1 Tax=Saponaria officinalis TaxID=3572 RepID=A0AAW1MRV7_SAPOF
MKLSWKKKNGNKRLAISNSSNLPFELDDFEDQTSLSSLSPTNNNNNIINININNKNCNNSDEPKKALDDFNPSSSNSSLSDDFLELGNKLAEEGKYREALGKWETAITLMPQKAVLHEQKAQVLLEIGDAWGSLKAATRATELDPEWAEAWTTLGRAQLNFGEPDAAIESFDKALAIKPDLAESRDDRQTAQLLIKKRKQLHTSGLSTDKSRYAVGDEGEGYLPGQG